MLGDQFVWSINEEIKYNISTNTSSITFHVAFIHNIMSSFVVMHVKDMVEINLWHLGF